MSRLINCCRLNCEVAALISEPSYVVLLCSYPFKGLALNVGNGFWSLSLSNRVKNYLKIFSKESEVVIEMVIDVKKWNHITSHRSKFFRKWASINLIASELL